MSKKITKTTLALIAILFTLAAGKNFATTFNVSAANFSFSPSNLSVNVGDTIKWIWSNGSHTTTCNGQNGTTRPSGATPWDSELSSGSPSFTYVIQVPGTYHYICVPHSPDMSGNITANVSSVTQITEIVRGYELLQNYPNPFNPVTNIKFSLTDASNVMLKIYDINGKEIETLVNERLNAGSYIVDWNAGNFPSGAYFYKMATNSFTDIKKMILLK